MPAIASIPPTIATGSVATPSPVTGRDDNEDDEVEDVDGVPGAASHDGVAGGYASGTASDGFTTRVAVIGPRVHAKFPAVSTHFPFSYAQPGQPVGWPAAFTDAPGQSTRPLRALSTSVAEHQLGRLGAVREYEPHRAIGHLPGSGR